MMLRVLILFGIVLIFRSHSNGMVLSGGFNRIDMAVILCALSIALNWVLLWQQIATLTFQLGELYTIFGIYFFSDVSSVTT